MSKFEKNPATDKYCLVKKNSDNTLNIRQLDETREPFVKELTVNLIAKREVLTTNLDRPRENLFYKVKFRYWIKEGNPDIYLTLIEKAWEQQSVFDNRQRIFGVYIRDFNGLGITREAPILNENYAEELRDILGIERLESEQITKAEAINLLTMGKIIGIFSEDLTKRL